MNAHEYKSNQDGFDLVDRKKKIFVQVTSNQKHKEKLQCTVKVLEKGNSSGYSRLIVLFISAKCTAQILRKKNEYEAFDIPKLYREIYYRCKEPAIMKEINGLLESVVSPVSHVQHTSEPAMMELPKQAVRKREKGLYIYLKALIENIFSFGQTANGLLLGGVACN